MSEGRGWRSFPTWSCYPQRTVRSGKLAVGVTRLRLRSAELQLQTSWELSTRALMLGIW